MAPDRSDGNLIKPEGFADYFCKLVTFIEDTKDYLKMTVYYCSVR